jgi:rhodanese-related sulfurtransferase
MKSTGSVMLFILSLFLFISFGADADTGYQEVSAPEVKKMLDEQNCILIHSLSKIEFEIQHIEKSINIPVVEMETTDKLPADKSTALIFYCMGKR